MRIKSSQGAREPGKARHRAERHLISSISLHFAVAERLWIRKPLTLIWIHCSLDTVSHGLSLSLFSSENGQKETLSNRSHCISLSPKGLYHVCIIGAFPRYLVMVFNGGVQAPPPKRTNSKTTTNTSASPLTRSLVFTQSQSHHHTPINPINPITKLELRLDL